MNITHRPDSRRGRRWIAHVVALGILASALSMADQPRRTITVFAAASLSDALTEVSQQFESSTGVGVTLSFASSGQLARQIESGAPAHLFISADESWMDYLQTRALLKPDSRRDLLTNRLTLVRSCDQQISLTIKPRFALESALAGGRLAIGDPPSVPAGRYAMEALTTLGVWPVRSASLLPAVDVRSALMYIARGEARLGIVYATDAAVDRRICLVDLFPENAHHPIVYPMALTLQPSIDGARYTDFLRQPASRKVFEKFGFGIAP